MTIVYSLDARLRGNDRKIAGIIDGGRKERGEKVKLGGQNPIPPAGSILHTFFSGLSMTKGEPQQCIPRLEIVFLNSSEDECC